MTSYIVFTDDVMFNPPSPPRTPLSTSAFEEALRDPVFQGLAMQALTKAHCAETLRCLLEVFKWELEPTEGAKMVILQGFVITDEICLGQPMKSNLLAGKASLLDLKSLLLNDLRFNPFLLDLL